MVKIGDVIHGYEIVGISNQKYMDGHKLFHVRCVKCGFEKKDVLMSSIKHRLTKDCFHIKDVSWSSPRLRDIFKDIVFRCYNEKSNAYRFYGYKNIKVCKEWLENPQKFNDWSIENGYDESLTIDRIDPMKGYSPENCRWVTLYENSKWKSTTRCIVVNGITDSGRGWSARLGFGVNYINVYIRKNGIEATIEFIKSRLN